MNREQIVSQYIELSVKHRQLPSIYRFSNWTDLSIVELKANFSSADEIQAEVWKRILERTLTALSGDADFTEYTVYEKLLAYHFTFIQIAAENRDFLKLKLRKLGPVKWESKDMEAMKSGFLNFIHEISQQGKETGEIPNRMILNNTLNQVAWYQKLYLLHFWARDESHAAEQTDAAVEKSTQWFFDIIGRNIVDTSFDFGRFFFQNFKLKKWFSL